MSCESNKVILLDKRKQITKKKQIPLNILRENLLDLLKRHNVNILEVPDDIPKKWEKHGDLVLISFHCLNHSIWKKIGNEVWDVVAESLKCKRVARKNVIASDNFRSPQIELLKGSDGWVTRIDNGIKMTFDVTKCMFSSGNISEKLRISKFDCRGEVIVDLFAGIGYFTLPFLIHAKAEKVHSCEWNPDAVIALKKNLILNGVDHKCVIHEGDNRQVCPKGIADRVNLGLIPTSEQGWSVGCEALKVNFGGILHIHSLVTSGLHPPNANIEQPSLLHFAEKKNMKKEWLHYAEETSIKITSILNNLGHQKWITEILHIERIKSYAPRIDHIVLDMKCLPL